MGREFSALVTITGHMEREVGGDIDQDRVTASLASHCLGEVVVGMLLNGKGLVLVPGGSAMVGEEQHMG